MVWWVYIVQPKSFKLTSYSMLLGRVVDPEWFVCFGADSGSGSDFLGSFGSDRIRLRIRIHNTAFGEDHMAFAD